MSNKNEVITCKVSKWFLWRAVFMSAMLLAFGGYFYYDGAVGYKKKNVQYYEYMAFLQAKKWFEDGAREAEKSGQPNHTSSAEGWKIYTEPLEVKVFVGHELVEEVTDVEGCFPEGHVFPKKLNPVFVNGYDKMAENNGAFALWEAYTKENGLDIGASKNFKSKEVIDEQFHWAIGSGILGLLAVFFLVRTNFRKMEVDGIAYTAPNGVRVPLESIYKIDKRKWSSKGLAYLYYKDGDKEGKVKVDGMVYGQFDAENPENAEVLFAHIENNVSAEIVDYEEEDDDTSEEPEVKVDKEESAS